MLVLGRKLGEEIVITVDGTTTITLRVVDVDRNRCRIGFVAPPNVQINRREIQDKVDGEKKEKTNASLP